MPPIFPEHMFKKPLQIQHKYEDQQVLGSLTKPINICLLALTGLRNCWFQSFFPSKYFTGSYCVTHYKKNKKS